MNYRKLRIAWSVFWGVAAVLLVVLWVRSYDYLDTIGTPPSVVTLWNGRLLTGGDVHVGPTPTGDEADDPVLRSTFGILILTTLDQDNLTYHGALHSLPLGVLVAVAGAITVAPWLCQRFSLRALLVATTLVALVLGLIVRAR